MGICIYCGKDAGLFRKYHKNCKQKHDKYLNMIQPVIQKVITQGTPIDECVGYVDNVCRIGVISKDERKSELLNGIDTIIQKSLEDSMLTNEEDNRINSLINAFKINAIDARHLKHANQLLQMRAIRAAASGTLEPLDKQDYPINFLKSEQLLYNFGNVKYFETKSKTEYVGGSHGVSIRIMKGVYYRIGGFKGRKVTTENSELLDIGILLLTSKNLYFYSGTSKFRIPYKKILSYTPSANGVEILKDLKTAKPQFFENNDGWFLYNMMQNIIINYE